MKTRLLLIVLVALVPLNLFAHAPKNLKLNYKAEEGKLEILIPHKVKKVEAHYIDVLTIWVDGEEYKTLTYDKQSTKESHELSIDLKLEKGSTVEVKAECNKMGSKKAKFTYK